MTKLGKKPISAVEKSRYSGMQFKPLPRVHLYVRSGAYGVVVGAPGLQEGGPGQGVGRVLQLPPVLHLHTGSAWDARAGWPYTFLSEYDHG